MFYNLHQADTMTKDLTLDPSELFLGLWLKYSLNGKIKKTFARGSHV